MEQDKDKDREPAPVRSSHRYQVVQVRDFHLTVIPFKSLISADLIAHVVDVSRNGVGVESKQPLAPGFVWFKERISGFKGGLIVWGRRSGEKFRAGIRFVPLSHAKEQLVQDRMSSIRPDQPLPNPEVIITTLLEAMTQERPAEQPAAGQPSPREVQSLRAEQDTPTEEDLIVQLRTLLSSL